MARIRSIKPDFFRHEALFEAEQASGLPLRMAFAGLWTAADREGRFKWQPRQLKLDCLPYDAVDFAAVLDTLEGAGLIVAYEVDGHRYGYVPSWNRHQHINQREAQSTLPEPPGVVTGDAHASTCNPVNAHGEGKGKEGEELEGKGEGETRAPAPEPALSDQDRAVCAEHGIPIDRIEAEMANCRAWHAANRKPITNWPATWRVWCLRHAQSFSGKPRPVAPTAAPAMVGIVPGSEPWEAWEGHYRVIQAKFRLTCMAEAANEGKPYMVPSLWPSGHPGASAATPAPAADLEAPKRKQA